jgi:hypothetical protein
MAKKKAAAGTVPQVIHELVAKFTEHEEMYRRGDYNETMLRRDFLDPFFAAIGWDIENKKGYAEAFREVIHEDSLKVELSVKAPDYCFRIGGTRKFFVEAKNRPSTSRRTSLPRFSSAAMRGRPNCRCRSSPISRNWPSMITPKVRKQSCKLAVAPILLGYCTAVPYYATLAV